MERLGKENNKQIDDLGSDGLLGWKVGYEAPPIRTGTGCSGRFFLYHHPTRPCNDIFLSSVYVCTLVWFRRYIQ